MSGMLLDAHALLWFAHAPERLSPKAREAILDTNNEIWISVAVLWELSIKITLGKLKIKESLEKLVDKQIRVNRFQILNIAPAHTYAVQALTFHHRDPFDRLLAAQSKFEKLSIVSVDTIFDQYKVKRVW